MMSSNDSILSRIEFPADLKQLRELDLISLSRELRKFIIDEASVNPGHLGASLGVVELTVALHYVYNTPYDKIVWDVGHQAYGHKILTGRKELFYSNRKLHGISGFPNPAESKYDAFGVGHASTSISAALGLAKSTELQGLTDRNIVAVIGDGSLTGGLAFEGLNNTGVERSNLLVILNDNNMAIDPNVGALKEYLLDITTSRTYNKLKNEVWNVLGKISKLGPNYQRLASQLESAIKTAVFQQSNFFEALNFRYFGPVDGHDVVYLTKVLSDLKHIEGPKLLHCITKKGKGFKQAENDQTTWHRAPGTFDKETGQLHKAGSDQPEPPRYQDVFGHTLVELADRNERVAGITPAMPTGSSMNIMMQKYPHRAFDVGIAEQHAVTFSAGLAIDGMVPFCNIYSTFMQRAYDQLVHDVALQNLNVVFCLDRGGLVGADGATHHGALDLSFMRSVPNMTVAAPMDEVEMRNMMFTAQLPNKGPFSIRYPRGRGVTIDWRQPMQEIPIGKGRKLQAGDDVAILTLGHTGNSAKQAIQELEAQNISIAHYDMRFLKPLDEELLHEVGKKFNHIITVEDGTILGGMGSAVMEFMAGHQYQARIRKLGIPDRFIEHGKPEELQKLCGFDAEGIARAIRAAVKPQVFSNAG
ncbi:MAG: 1-deoxy-D-xylulose-5-phosphate synthase [Bacteroidales bacterium]|nr:1-deoxy-D-xylulose-5-phosphate synthase [Bacteroidales bacterium]